MARILDVRSKLISFCILFFPAAALAAFLFPLKRVFGDEDTLLQFYPYAAFFSKALHNGTSFIFSNQLLAGFPLGATMNGGFFNPVHFVVFRFADFLTGYHALAVCYFAAGFYCMYILLRRLDLGEWEALFGATIYGLGQYSLTWLAILPAAQILFFVPLLFRSVLDIRQWRWFTVAVLSAAWALVGAMPQMAVAAIASAGVFAIFQDAEGSTFQFKNLKRTFWYGFAMILGAGLAAPYLFFAQAQVALSNRPYLTFAEYHASSLPWGSLLRYILPTLQLPFLVSAEPVAIEFVPFLLALWGWWVYRQERVTKFFAIFGVAAALAALAYAPLTLLLHYVPIFSYFRGPGRYIFLTAFALSVLAAKGIGALRTDGGPEHFRRWLYCGLRIWGTIGVIAIGATMASKFLYAPILALLKNYFDIHLYARTSGLALATYHQAIERYLEQGLSAFSFTAPAFLMVFCSTTAALGVLAYAVKKRSFRNTNIAILSLLLFAESFGGYVLAGQFIPKTVLKEPPFVAVIKKLEEGRALPYRVFALWPLQENYRQVILASDAPRVAQERFLLSGLTPNANLFWDISSVDGYDNLMASNISERLAGAGSERATFGELLALAPLSPEEKLSRFYGELPTLGDLGVKYIVAAFSLTHPDLSIRATSMEVPGVTLYLYEYAKAEPLLAFVPEENQNRMDTLHAVRSSDGFIEADVKTVKPRMLVFRFTAVPGWQGYLDDEPVTLEKSGAFQTMRVPTGAHRVRFEFSYKAALGIH
ncbi:MAG: hypothetical protein Q7S09_03615 [bacterium]|nr:hypothetical protein [bacterium]